MADPRAARDTAQRSGRRLSLRARITLAATAIVGITLIAGAVLFGMLLRFALVDQLATAVESDAEQYAALASASALPADLDLDDGFVQVLDGSGRVVAASDDIEGIGALIVQDDDTWTIELPGESDDYLVSAADVDGGSRTTVIAGRSLEAVDDTTDTVAQLLVGAVPVLIGVVALTTWVVVRRALTPVALMTGEVASITESNLDKRVADPGGSDEIARLATTMNSMLGRLEVAQQSQRQFISDASHELKSPLASLRQYAEVARLHPERVSADELSDAVLDEGARLERLVQGMLLLAKADESSLPRRATTVDLDDIVLREARRLRDSTSLAVDTTAVGAARVVGDAQLLGQLVRNLVDNAARHARSRVALTLTATEASGVLFAVDDDGDGVAERERERVFERFVRLDDARARDSGGSGLGLAIVRELVRAHGGTVAATSGALGGARFEVRVPAASEF
ncbi:ATP-binding protein [Marisediminicola senii]|uniref:ATP-binding protein n=1 Tax=Marisediminicola senii TaxID=2711233 RepID=UPI0013ECC00D|nr:ATP-binding protein [Marisediminicola senii]